MFKPNNQHSTGRPKGSSNLATSKVRAAFTLLIENNLEKMQDDINQLEPKDRLKILIDLSSYVLPKLRQIEIEQTKPNEDDTLRKLMEFSEAEFDKLD